MDSGATNIFNQSLNTTSNVTFDFLVITNINSTNWGNVTITESQISDLVHTGASNIFNQSLNTTSNVTFDFLVITNVNSTNWGNVTITESQISDLVHTGASNIFNQTLNTTSNVTFDFLVITNINSTIWTNVTITESQISDLDHTVADDTILSSLLNITGIDDNACTGTNKVINVSFDNGNLNVTCAADLDSGASNIFNQSLNTTSNVTFDFLVVTNLNSTIWTNVTITESQISDLVHTVDTNETGRFSNLTDSDCAAGQLVIGIQVNGTVLCVNDANTGASNIFNQSLNTTSNVTFDFLVISNVNSTSWTNVTITESQISDLDHTIADDTILLSLLNITGIDDNACTGTNKVINVSFDNGNLNVTCSADLDSGATNIFNQSLNTTSNVTFDFLVVTNLNSTNWGNVTITESQISDLVHPGNCSGDLSCAVNLLYESELNTFAELDTQIADASMCRLDVAQTFTAEPVFAAGINTTIGENVTIGTAEQVYNGSCLNTYVSGTLVMSIGCS